MKRVKNTVRVNFPKSWTSGFIQIIARLSVFCDLMYVHVYPQSHNIPILFNTLNQYWCIA